MIGCHSINRNGQVLLFPPDCSVGQYDDTTTSECVDYPTGTTTTGIGSTSEADYSKL